MNAATSLAERKLEIRKQIKQRLTAYLGSERRSDLDQRIAGNLEQVVRGTRGSVAVFRAFSDEPDVYTFLKGRAGLRLAFPKVEGSDLKFYRFKGQEAWQKGQFGNLEPDHAAAELQPLDELSMVCVPGMAFDHAGGRLGRGQGYYDRALASFKGAKVGVAYMAQVVSEPLPREPHDVTMNYLVTENFLLKMKG